MVALQQNKPVLYCSPTSKSALKFLHHFRQSLCFGWMPSIIIVPVFVKHLVSRRRRFVCLLYLVFRKHTNCQGDHTALLTDTATRQAFFASHLNKSLIILNISNILTH